MSFGPDKAELRASRLAWRRALTPEVFRAHSRAIAERLRSLPVFQNAPATVMLRAMIDFSLGKARSSRYRHASRHLMECSSLAAKIEDYLKFETHDAFLNRLKKEHGRKSGFWSLIE